ncbi:MAG: hypothetical protein NPIRA04_05680 [Nitrospirales bacterium]|nr:MAG: hypothetical protein NPIRA04_05680 [Nitrospirales bacterium]
MQSVYLYGLMFLGFALFFVRLNHVAEYVFVALVVIWIAEKLYTRNFHWRSTFLDWPLLLFLTWIFVTGFFAVDPEYSFNEWRKTLPRFLIFWFVVQSITTENQVRSVLFASSLGLGVLSLIEVTYYFWIGGELLDFSLVWGSRAGDLTGSSQWLGTYLVLGFPIVFLGVWTGPVGKLRVAYIAICTVMLGAVLLVHTRATWLAIGIECLVLGVLTLNRYWRVRVLILMATLVLVLLPFGIAKLSFLTDLHVANPTTLQLRLNTWWFAIDRIVDQPILGLTGIGYGKHSFNTAYPNLGPGFHTHIHNMVIARVVQLGLPGLVLFGWIFWVILRWSYRGFKTFSHLFVGRLSLTILLGTVGLLVRNLFDDMFIGSVVYVFWLFIGLFWVTLSLHGMGIAAAMKRPELSEHQ